MPHDVSIQGPGRPALPRRRVRAAFEKHLIAYLKREELTLRDFVRRALGGDDSQSTYAAVSTILNGRVQTAGLVYQARLKALARASGWPEDCPADELVKIEPLQ
jgi:hypothetical protein